MKKKKYYGSKKLFLTFSSEDTLSYSTIIENIMVMLYLDEADDMLSYKEAKEALNELSRDDYDELYSTAVSFYSDWDTQRYMDRYGICEGMRLEVLDDEDAERFLDDVESLSWNGFIAWELPESGWE